MPSTWIALLTGADLPRRRGAGGARFHTATALRLTGVRRASPGRGRGVFALGTAGGRHLGWSTNRISSWLKSAEAALSLSKRAPSQPPPAGTTLSSRQRNSFPGSCSRMNGSRWSTRRSRLPFIAWKTAELWHFESSNIRRGALEALDRYCRADRREGKVGSGGGAHPRASRPLALRCPTSPQRRGSVYRATLLPLARANVPHSGRQTGDRQPVSQRHAQGAD
jgi:hypothetical protein